MAMSASLDHLYTYSDIYDTLDTCQELELLLGRLRRQQLLSDVEWMQSRQNLAEIRTRLEGRLDGADS